MSEFSLKAVSYALTALLCAISAMIVAKGLFTSPTLPAGKAGIESPAPAGQGGPGAAKGDLSGGGDVEAIVSRNLFSAVRKEAVEAPSDDAALPDSSVAYDLIGTAVHTDPQWSMAFLVDKSSRAPKNVSVGQALGEAVVLSIEDDHMVLLRQGQQEVLKKKP
ncbi:type II secretion system protein N [Fundidesulfovibrio agrisoli]|uniref:type II secretion system protein N n=1 Tax=Fundidesulfovibrio agrisoli TaxID=2922717 RepID=UPI001FADB474|nr:type II secretion system protein N [Fundidesulfovibrio agrisoli]